VHAAVVVVWVVVVGQVLVVVHVGRLAVEVEGGPRRLHGAQGLAVHGAAEDPLAEQQSAWSAVWPRPYCLTSEPNTSDIDPFSAPGCLWYTSPAVYWVTPWVSS
jgi:hypothetical protein